MKRAMLLPFVCTVALALSVPSFGHTGLEFFLPEVPDPDAMTMDGDDGDWGWYDNDFALSTPPGDDFWSPEGNGVIDPEDYQATVRLAYSRPPDNRLYFFYRIVDDSLRRSEPEIRRLWWDDWTQLNLDNDHSGGPGLGANLEEASNHNRYHLRMLPGPDNITAFNSQIEVLGDEALGWSQDVDFDGNFTGIWDLAWTLNPPDANDGTLDYEATWEGRFITHDTHGLSQAESTRHIYSAGQITHIGPLLHDCDGQPSNYSFFLKDRFTGDENPRAYDVDGDAFPDWTLLECENCPNAGGSGQGATAVESSSWGLIKSHLSSQLK